MAHSLHGSYRRHVVGIPCCIGVTRMRRKLMNGCKLLCVKIFTSRNTPYANNQPSEFSDFCTLTQFLFTLGIPPTWRRCHCTSFIAVQRHHILSCYCGAAVGLPSLNGLVIPLTFCPSLSVKLSRMNFLEEHCQNYFVVR